MTGSGVTIVAIRSRSRRPRIFPLAAGEVGDQLALVAADPACERGDQEPKAKEVGRHARILVVSQVVV